MLTGQQSRQARDFNYGGKKKKNKEQRKSREEIDRVRVVTGIGSCTREDQREIGKMLGCNICMCIPDSSGWRGDCRISKGLPIEIIIFSGGTRQAEGS